MIQHAPGFDDITGGGLPRGRPTLVCGGPGCGKTLFGLEFLLRGVLLYDEPGVCMVFEESREDLAKNVSSLGYDLEDLFVRLGSRDAANTLSMLSRILGHDVKVAHDGREAVAMAGRFLPDLVLMDIGMPVMHGYEAARNIRGEKWGQDLVLVALTGWGQKEDRNKAKAAGFHQHLVKPVKNESFEELLAQQLKERKRGASRVRSSPGDA